MTDEARQVWPLTEAERCELLRLARESVRVAAHEDAVRPAPTSITPALRAPGGAFVTLRLYGELRGCIGTVWPRDPLYDTVVRMARASALQDPRFPPLPPSEVSRVHIEISRLSPPRLVTADAVDVRRHGLYVVREAQRGLLLPQVPRRFGWTAEQFLAETCIKAGLEPEAWQHPATRLFVFEAEIFSESDPTASE